ncbi:MULTISPECIES: DUF4168 domain-containing protein [unclassified Yoonia]|uniref:DUF4168 domain-containing protein n=1 Tax=unclassified Yoonia TaxID=2629118 RepID=UPI002AFFD2CA|nr:MULTISPECIES: DUF4168 domain-containing protein [unclassified Yoonia]
MTRITQISAIAVAALFAAAPVTVMAQAEPATPPVTQETAPMAQEVSSAEIDAFATAYEDVIAIDAEYAPQLEQETDPQAQQLLLEEAQIEKASVVEAVDGITVDRYVEILTMAQADPELTAQIVERLEQ